MSTTIRLSLDHGTLTSASMVQTKSIQWNSDRLETNGTSDAAIKLDLPVNEKYSVGEINKRRCHVNNAEMYRQLYRKSVDDGDNFWRDMAVDFLRWRRLFTKTRTSDLKRGAIAWFVNGALNVSDNCVDRWVEKHPQRTALIWEADDPAESRRISYEDLQGMVCRVANMLIRLGVRRYDNVAIYMPMCPYLVYCMLACARIGAVHMIVFPGFAPANLAERIIDTKAKIVITADYGIRGGKEIPLKRNVDEALAICPEVTTCVVFARLGKSVNWVENRDVKAIELMYAMRPHCPAIEVDSEDPLFILHTSGSTGKPKGITHSTAGYLLWAALTHKFIFDYHPGDVYACVADVGWITGHTYVVYGPLCNGATTVLFESTPTYPNPGRYWEMIERLEVSSFYTSPTALRALMRHGDAWPKQYDLSSLRVLGSVGETINPEAWRWYYNVIGGGRCSVVDTYWQTETGGHVLTPFPGATDLKPGCAGQPFFGIIPALMDPTTGEEIEGNDVSGHLVIKRDWPSMMRTIVGDHERLLLDYLSPYPGCYFTGDGAYRDADGLYWVTGRVDDTINISGHRVGTAEIEGCVCKHQDVVECAAVPVAHDVKGSTICCFVVLRMTADNSPMIDFGNLRTELCTLVRKNIGAIVIPDKIIFLDFLPKTKSGKIVRRILRKIGGEDYDNLGNMETLVNPEIIEGLISTARQQCESITSMAKQQCTV